jgi:hypothetical protein
MEKFKKEAEPDNKACVPTLPTLGDRGSLIETSETEQSFIRAMLKNIRKTRIVGESLTLWTIVIALLVLWALEFGIGDATVGNLVPYWLLS